jgi:diguanylate cyclase (GGDEF)-like protein
MPHAFPRKLRWLFRVGAGVLACALLAVIARVVDQAEQSSLHNLQDRFRLRAEIAEPFLRSYVRDLLQREEKIARIELNTAQVPDADFERVVRVFGFEAAVIMDASGKLMKVFPAKPQIIGTDVATRYPHLRDALAKGQAVSSVTPSAAAGTPVVAFATRYDSDAGPRVFSGAYDVSQTPLRAYMSNLIAIPGASSDLIDANGAVVASNRPIEMTKAALETVDPLLARAMRNVGTTEYQDGGGAKLFVVRTVRGTPWQIVAAVHETALYAPIGGRRHRVYWWLFAAFCAAVLVAALLLVRLIESRGELRAMNGFLARLARVDRLTDLPNRLYVEEQLARMISASRRYAQPLSIFLVDVDHFKAVNDSYGHTAGDEVLRILAGRMAEVFRKEDVFGRWGGEEFIALLPNARAEGAAIVANRVRTAANRAPIVTSKGQTLQVTVSIGCATTMDALDETLVQRADAALYCAKDLGRNCVFSSVAPAPPIGDAQLAGI